MDSIRKDILRAELAGGGRLLKRRREFNRQLRLRKSGGPKKRNARQRSPSRRTEKALVLVVKWPYLKDKEEPPQYDRAYLSSMGWKQKKLATSRYKSLRRHVLQGDPSTERQVRAHVHSAWKETQFDDGSNKKTIDIHALTERHRGKCRECSKKYERYGHTKTRPTPACRKCVKALCECVGRNKRSGRCIKFSCARVV